MSKKRKREEKTSIPLAQDLRSPYSPFCVHVPSFCYFCELSYPRLLGIIDQLHGPYLCVSYCSVECYRKSIQERCMKLGCEEETVMNSFLCKRHVTGER